MDYFSQSPLFQARKVLRYCRLYGPRRTWIKVQGQRHKRKRLETLPPSSPPADGQPVGLIGCGNYAYSNIAYYLTRNFGRVIGGCMDVDPHHAASLARRYRVPLHTTDAARLLDDERLRLFYVASNHASHAEYAVEALRRGKDVYIEKPHVVSEEQLRRLAAAMRDSDGRVYLGFNRPGSRLGRLVREHLSRESGPGVYNWFVAGHAIDPDHWYFRPQEGGRVLGNLCHWTDFLYTLVTEVRFPIRIVPTRHERSDVDIGVNYVFGDGTIGAITFSAKGHTFEGVKERFAGHRGDTLLSLDDFQRLTVEVVERKHRYRNLFRDHGHEANITAAYRNAIGREPYDRPARLEHVVGTALLFLKTREALETGRPVVLDAGEIGASLRSASPAAA